MVVREIECAAMQRYIYRKTVQHHDYLIHNTKQVRPINTISTATEEITNQPSSKMKREDYTNKLG
jgi:hypothetical protein